MRSRAVVSFLTRNQFFRVQDRLPVEYDMEPGTASVCAVFQEGEHGPERHIEMPVQAFATLVTELMAMPPERSRPELADRLEKARDLADPARRALREQRDEDDRNTRPSGADQ